jgi:hypothetical protein
MVAGLVEALDPAGVIGSCIAADEGLTGDVHAFLLTED